MNKRAQSFERMVKMAQVVMPIGDPRASASGIAEIVRFLMARVPPEKYDELMYKLRHRIWNLNEIEISNKNLVPGSAIGQTLTFIKNILAGHNPSYIREILRNIVFELSSKPK